MVTEIALCGLGSTIAASGMEEAIVSICGAEEIVNAMTRSYTNVACDCPCSSRSRLYFRLCVCFRGVCSRLLRSVETGVANACPRHHDGRDDDGDAFFVYALAPKERVLLL
jgi:hypothetical protein